MPKKKETNENQYTVKYVFAQDYNPLYINGAYGGPTLNGDIVASFYLERHPLPKQEILDSNGHTVETEPQDLRNSVVRYIQNGIIMDVATAELIVQWLQEKIAAIKNSPSDK